MKRLGLLVLLALFVGAAPSSAQQAASSVDVVVVNGYLDGRKADFVAEAIRKSDADVIVLQLDVPAVLDDDIGDLIDAVKSASVPVTAWVGPDPAVAHGAALDLLAAAQVRGAAPGAALGWWSPGIAGGTERTPGADSPVPAGLVDDRIEVDSPIADLVDEVVPSIGQFVISLDGSTLRTGSGGAVTLTTAIPGVEDGVDVLKPAGTVRFVEPGLADRVFTTAGRPEATFFFLMIGAAFAVFEFYAAGPGVAAGIAVVSLLLAGYGLATLPLWWPTLPAIALGIVLYVIEFQRNDLGWKSALGTALLFFGGWRLTDAAPQIVPIWWQVLLVVVGTGLFFAFALTTVVRARFSTQTIGRDHLLGAVGTAVGEIAPDGVVEVDGARWRARSTRVSGITAGDAVRIARVDGIVLEVDKVE